MSAREVEFSDHALRQLKERELPRHVVLETIQTPDEITEGHSGRKIARKVIRLGRLEWLFRVVYMEEGGKLEVVTVYRTTKISKYLKR